MSMGDKIRHAAAAKRAEATQAWATFDELRKSAVAEGADLDVKGEAFATLEDASKAYDTLREEADELDSKAAAAEAMDGKQPPPIRNPLEAAGVPDPGARGRKSWGEILTASEVYAHLKASGVLASDGIPIGATSPIQIATRAEFRSMLAGSAFKTLITGSDTSGGAFSDADRQPGFIDLARRVRRIVGLVNVGATDSDVVEWVQHDSRTNAAAETAEAVATGDGSGAAPESAAAFSIQTSTVRDITHYLPVTKRSLADGAQLEAVLDQELRDGVEERLDGQLLNGNGTAPNLRGILNTAGIATQALGLDSRSDAIHKAITQVRLAFHEPVAIVIHPSDWEQVVLEKATTGEYIYGPPSQPQRDSIWGLLPVVTTAVTAGTALLGDFRRGSTLWIREGLAVALSDSHSDFFIRRMVAMLAVMRVAFAVQRPTAFCSVTGI